MIALSWALVEMVEFALLRLYSRKQAPASSSHERFMDLVPRFLRHESTQKSYRKILHCALAY